MTIKANLTGTGSSAANASATVGGVNTSIAAAGTGQSDAPLLPRASNIYITSTSGSNCVILPPGVGTTQKLAAGDYMRIINFSGQTLNVYPPTGGKIQNGSANAAYTGLTNNKVAEFICIDGTNFAVNQSA